MRIRVHRTVFLSTVSMLPFVLLPVSGELFAVLVGFMGLVALLSRCVRPVLVMPFLFFALFGGISQLIAQTGDRPAFLGPQGSSTNLLQPLWLVGMHGWTPEDGDSLPGQWTDDGFVRILRRNAQGRLHAEVLANAFIPIKEREEYTLSMYIRHDGTLSFALSFFTSTGHHVVPVKSEDVGGGLRRVWASYRTQVGDRTIRAPDLVDLAGTWTRLEIGYPQLEIGSHPSPYTEPIGNRDRTGLPTKTPVMNLLPNGRLASLQRFSKDRGYSPFALRLPDGFVRVERAHNDQTDEILLNASISIKEGEEYTLSMYIRHDGTLSFALSFFTSTGHHVVPVKSEDVGGGLRRVWASYRTQAGDRTIRAPDLVDLAGTWTRLEIGYPQLEIGSHPSPYTVPPENSFLLERVLWWVGLGFSAWLGLQGVRALLTLLGQKMLGVALLTGFLVQVLLALLERASLGWEGRVGGLSAHANLFGHVATSSALFAVLALPASFAVPCVVLGFVSVLLSESRTALLGLIPAVGILLWRLPVQLRLSTLTALLIAFFALGQGTQNRLLDVKATWDSRLEIWQLAGQAIAQHPLAGIGQFNFGNFYERRRPVTAIDARVEHPHNVFIGVLVSGGLLGLLALLGLVVPLIYVISRSGRWDILMGCFGFLILNILDETLFTAGVMYALLAAVALVLVKPVLQSGTFMPVEAVRFFKRR